MKTQSVNTETRELTPDELEQVSGGLSEAWRQFLTPIAEGAMGPLGPVVKALTSNF